MLRHVVTHLRRQDWTAVVIEPVVPIVDVLIGVQPPGRMPAQRRMASVACCCNTLDRCSIPFPCSIAAAAHCGWIVRAFAAS